MVATKKKTVSRKKTTKKKAKTIPMMDSKKSRNFGTGGAPARTVYIVDGSRTPFLKARNKPGPFPAADLAVNCGRALLSRQNFAPSAINEVILGCVMPGPDEANIARITALRLGIGNDVPAWTVQRNCASGLQALDCAAMEIAANRADLILAGGVEAMSHCPVLYTEEMVAWLGKLASSKTLVQRLKTFSQIRPRHLKPVIGLLRGLTDPVVGLSMGQTAENLAYRFHITREQMDAYAVRSHQRLAAAQDAGHLDEIEPLYDRHGTVYSSDDGLRRDSSMENLARLRPVFDKPFGMVTAGNSAQVTDGASLLLLASEKAVEEHNLPVLGKIIDTQWAALEPAQMGLGPVHAITPLLQRHELEIKNIDYWEINEAFAAQVLACLAAWRDDDYCKTELGISGALGRLDEEQLNIDGGGVSLGHPVGASGARIVLHLLEVLKRNKSHRGIASLCIGGGQGGAMLVERI